MPTIVFQGIQSCIEPQMVETRTLRLKLSSPNLESGSWNVLQSLANSPRTPKQTEPSYVHPMTINSYSRLSSRSLELCTETLGCETGTDVIENTLFSFLSRESKEEENKTREQPKPRQSSENKKENIRSFPPPLTTMSGANSLQVRPVREGGRLVIQAVEAPSSHGCFQAERSNGRLTLSLFKDFESDENENENEMEDLENEMDCEKEENVFEEVDEDEEYEDFEVKNEVFVDGDMEGNKKEAGGKMGIGNVQRLRRCQDGGRCIKDLCNWEPFWVATS